MSAATQPRGRIVLGRIQGAVDRPKSAYQRIARGALPAPKRSVAFYPGEEPVPDHRIEGLHGARSEIIDADDLDNAQRYRYVYDDQTGLLIRFEHSLSPATKKVIEEIRKPAKIATAGAIVGMILGTIFVGLLFAKAFGDAGDVDDAE